MVPLGSGGFGLISKAQYRGQAVAVKQFESDAASRHDAVREVAAQASFSHPFIVSLFGVTTHAVPRIVMELAPLGDLYHNFHVPSALDAKHARLQERHRALEAAITEAACP